VGDPNAEQEGSLHGADGARRGWVALGRGQQQGGAAITEGFTGLCQ
jgi:hypothetical protein